MNLPLCLTLFTLLIPYEVRDITLACYVIQFCTKDSIGAATSGNVLLDVDHLPNENSNQLTHSCSLIRIFNGHILDSHGCKVSSCGHGIFLSDCADAQTDLSHR